MTNTFADNYLTQLNDLLESLPQSVMQDIHEAINATRDKKGRIFVAGNGGSASTVNHFASDFSKNAVLRETGKFTVISLSALTEAITAYGNDDGYENSFYHQLRNFYPDENDLILLVSASGNSPNIIKVAEFCKENNTKIVSLTGFDGGKLKPLSDINITMNSDSYERVEDVQSIILHMITYSFKILN